MFQKKRPTKSLITFKSLGGNIARFSISTYKNKEITKEVNNQKFNKLQEINKEIQAQEKNNQNDKKLLDINLVNDQKLVKQIDTNLDFK